jgi:hypothetical protein
MRCMRTTLTLDDDLAALLKRRARELGVPFKEVVNRTIRTGLAYLREAEASLRRRQGKAAAVRRHPAPKTLPHSFGLRPGIDPDKLGQLADELEAETCAEKLDDPAGRKRPRSRAQP